MHAWASMVNLTNLAAAFGSAQYIDDDYDNESGPVWVSWLIEQQIKNNLVKSIKEFFAENEKKAKKSPGDNEMGQILICCYCQVEADLERNRCPECRGSEFIATQKLNYYQSFEEIIGL
jgi:hypothetical protein